MHTLLMAYIIFLAHHIYYRGKGRLHTVYNAKVESQGGSMQNTWVCYFYNKIWPQRSQIHNGRKINKQKANVGKAIMRNSWTCYSIQVSVGAIITNECGTPKLELMHITLLFSVDGAPFGKILVNAALNDAPWQNIRQPPFNNKKRTATQK